MGQGEGMQVVGQVGGRDKWGGSDGMDGAGGGHAGCGAGRKPRLLGLV